MDGTLEMTYGWIHQAINAKTRRWCSGSLPDLEGVSRAVQHFHADHLRVRPLQHAQEVVPVRNLTQLE